MNKDQFAYLNIEIKALESERDALKAEKDRQGRLVDELLRMDKGHRKEISKLKAELEDKKNFKGNGYYLGMEETYTRAIDDWKSRADKYKEALEKINVNFGIPLSEKTPISQYVAEQTYKDVQEALKEDK